LHLEERKQLNMNNMYGIFAGVGFTLLFASVFLAFREYGYMQSAEQHLIPAILVALILAIILLGAAAVLNRIREE
jgi:hypothetical protein